MFEPSTRFYVRAKEWLIEAGLGPEIEWQQSRDPVTVDEPTFLAEAAWVIYNSGFREAIVRRKFDFISLCFCDWASKEIVEAGSKCVDAAMLAIANRRKHEAVLAVARRIAATGYRAFYDGLLENPIAELQRLPFIGPVTAVHLAKNLGFDVAKPDRHLVRLHKALGFPDVAKMCAHLATVTGDPVRVVDLVLWRYLERRAAGAAT
jgi:hypothetical protein